MQLVSVVQAYQQDCRKCGNREGASREIVHARGKLSLCKSSNTPRIASKSPNGLYNFPRWVMVAQNLTLWRNSYGYQTIVVSCSRWSRARLQIWHFWNRILKFCFLTHLAFIENQNKPKCGLFLFISFFSRKGLALPNIVRAASSLEISDKSLWSCMGQRFCCCPKNVRCIL